MDKNGNIAYQITQSKGISSVPGGSLTLIMTITNAPTVMNLNGPSNQTGGSVATPIELIPAAAGMELVTIPTYDNSKNYYGVTIVLDLGHQGQKCTVKTPIPKLRDK